MSAPIYRGGRPFIKPGIRLANAIIVALQGAGAPTNGTSGTGAGVAGPGSVYVDRTAGVWYTNTNTKASPTWSLLSSASTAGFVTGVGSSYKVARGTHQQAAASDTIVSGLTTVVSVVTTFRDTPTAKQTYLTTSIGDQAGTPAAGSFLSRTFKSTYAAADDFTDNLTFYWVAIGT